MFTGAVSGVGGGMIRDVLTGEVPHVLYRAGDLYAPAAAIGTATVFLLWPVGTLPALAIGGILTAGIRLASRLSVRPSCGYGVAATQPNTFGPMTI